MTAPIPFRDNPAMSEREAVRLWEDTVGDSGEAPTDEELTTFANAVLASSRKGTPWGW
jgi:hypothetical protein